MRPKAEAALAGDTDRRFMAAAIRLSRRHLGQTATNPSVATIIVRDEDDGPIIVGSGVTAVGGRPHAEPQALAEAGERARGATAYVTLEPCAHHGRTPPCAEALVTAGIARVVGGAGDPDPRVAGRGYAILRAAGIEVVEGVLADRAANAMAGYLIRSVRKRPEVILKIAVSADGMIGKKCSGQIAITGDVSRRQVHVMRAEADAILIGVGTAIADDPQLTCRLPGLEGRSPARIVLDRNARLSPASRLVASAREAPLFVAVGANADPGRRSALAQRGVEFLAADMVGDRMALPELMEDLSARGMMSLMVEGGAVAARAFLAEGLVDRLALFVGPGTVGANGIASPTSGACPPAGFSLAREARYGDDRYLEFVKDA